MLIGGETIGEGILSEVTNPYDGTVIDTIIEATPEHVDAAVDAAQAALGPMAELTAYERGDLLYAAYRTLSERAEQFATTICQEVGKTIREATGEVGRALEVLRLSAEEARRFAGDHLPLDAAPNGAGKIGFSMRVPAGVVAAIVPFNFPLVLAAHKLGPALAVGNSVVLKPAPQAPLASCMFGYLLDEAGFPPGAVNVIPGGAEVGDALVRDERVRIVAFGGSDRTGDAVARAAGAKKLLLECGSASAVTIMPTADLSKALPACVRAGYAVAGQMCISVQKVLVHRDLYDHFAAAFTEQVSRLRTGDPRKEQTDVGPVISVAAAERLTEWIDQARAQGATVLAGGTHERTLFAPTVLGNVTRGMKVFTEEVFGPVVSLVRVNSLDEAIELTNATRYGLNTGLYTNRLDEALAFIRRVHHGSVLINETSAWRADLMPYGGVKSSGIGREGVRYAMDEMSEHKVVSMQI